ncbi:septum formation initiator family protein [Psychroflexus sp. CAK8W]|uniref:Septum formation initiator family protein n=1 Tax=Psychroflexus longus TaxID=2873596 RepID=A0ABS7XID0_9FLAO|nr:septum formation initiator family protein [Psychroflexus longus]MBZ9778723.1 septum formation initiator family protein [Psychroflexus longus]
MKYKDLKQKPWFKFMSNKYVLVLTVFVVWMLFLDSNSWLIHRELNQEIDEIKANKFYYQTEIQKDKQILNELKDSIEIERFARETYFMKRPNEDVYIIEYEDSLKTDKDE